MSKFKGTKGEWSLQYDFTIFHPTILGEVICNVSNLVAQPNAENSFFTKYSEEEARANSLLISKSPELLEQLETMYNFYEDLAVKINSDDFDEEFRSKWNPIMSRTEKLIKQATTL